MQTEAMKAADVSVGDLVRISGDTAIVIGPEEIRENYKPRNWDDKYDKKYVSVHMLGSNHYTGYIPSSIKKIK